MEGPDAEGIVLLPDNGTKGLWDDPKNLKTLLRGFFIACAALLALDLIFIVHLTHKHLSFHEGVFPAENWFGFYSAYGLVACVLLVVVAKQLRKVLMRGEDYYER